MALLTREQVLAAQDRKSADVEVPEWGGGVRVSSLSAKQRLEYDAERADGGEVVTLLLVRAVVDEAGKPLFTTADIPALQEKHPAALLRIFRAAADLNVLSSEAVEKIAGE